VGLIGVRLVSCVCAVVCGLTAAALAKQSAKCMVQSAVQPAEHSAPCTLHPALATLALLFTLGQPMLFLHSFSEMTELPFAAVAGLAVLAYQRRRWGAMAALTALLPLGRPEGFAFVLLAAIALIVDRRSIWLLILPLPLIAWDLAGWISTDRHGPWWHWLAGNWPYSGSSAYGHGSPLHFILRLPMVVAPLALPAMWIGMWIALRSARGDRAIAALPLFFLFAHSILYATGKLASNGEVRYLLIVAPLWGVLSAIGWQWMFDRLRWRHAIRWATAAVLLPIVINLFVPIVPIHAQPQLLAAKRAAEWYRSTALRDSYPNLLYAHPGIAYYLNTTPGQAESKIPWGRWSVLAKPPPSGTILLWDPDFCSKNADASNTVTLDEVRAAGWIEPTDLNATAGINEKPLAEPTQRWHLFLSP
jgi:hypothetical protein